MAFATTALAERRVALVLGADAYETIRPLDNAVNDAIAMRDTLERLGFEVFLETDRDLRRMRRALEDFVYDAEGADVALVYFSGHGVEVDGDNRLLPIDASAASLADLTRTSLSLEEIRQTIAHVAPIGLIVLDACRTDPFGSIAASNAEGRGADTLVPDIAREVSPGLGRMGRSENVLYAFAAAPGETASDGSDGHSPFTSALTRYFGTDGLEIRSVLTLVQQEVYDRSRGRQLPYVESGLPRTFFASTTREELPERERLLLAMADITPTIRNQVEKIAAERDMPLAPLYAALISVHGGGLSADERGAKLLEAAKAFADVRAEMRNLASTDPRVDELRRKADELLSLGVFDGARSALAEAAAIDNSSRTALKANFVSRTLSEAATHSLSGGAARANLKYAEAISSYEKASALYEEIDAEPLSAADRQSQITTWRALGETFEIIGSLAGATRAYEKENRLAARRAAGDPSNSEWQYEVSVSQIAVGDVRRLAGNLAGALDSYETSFEIRQRLAAAAPESGSRERDLSHARNRIANVKFEQKAYAEARELYAASAASAERLVQRDPENTRWQSDIAVANDMIARIMLLQGDIDGAYDTYRKNLDIFERLWSHEPDNTEWRQSVSLAYSRMGDIAMEDGDMEIAEVDYNESLVIAEWLATHDPGNTEYQIGVSIAQDRMGDMYLKRGQPARALFRYSLAKSTRERMTALDPLNTEWLHTLAISYQKIATVRLAQERLPDALAAYEANRQIAQELAKGDPANVERQVDLAFALEKVAETQFKLGDRTGALQASHDAVAIREKMAAANPASDELQWSLFIGYWYIGKHGDDPVGYFQKALNLIQGLADGGRLASGRQEWVWRTWAELELAKVGGANGDWTVPE